MKAIVVGGGASGMFCAIRAAERGVKVTLLEQNEKLGRKLYITGKGRCNFTNACPPEEFRAHVVSNPRFLYSASEALTSDDVIRLFDEWGLTSKVERGRRVFPASDRAADVIDTLVSQLKRRNVRVITGAKVTGLLTDADGNVTGVHARVKDENVTMEAEAVVLATGGMSYPSTGSGGDGYRFAAKAGLKVTTLSPSLVPFNCAEEYVRDLQGLSLKNVELIITDGKKERFREFGELLFTHFGISGPLVLSASAVLGPVAGGKTLSGVIDLKPAVSAEQLDARFRREFDQHAKKALRNILHEFYPAKLTAVIPRVADVDEDKRCADVTKEERLRLVRTTKAFPLTITSLRGWNEAVVTKGGVDVREIDPRTMAAKKRKGLYCIGELLDLDAYTGGYNLQIAWCTAAMCADALGT